MLAPNRRLLLLLGATCYPSVACCIKFIYVLFSHKIFYATYHRHKMLIEKGNFIVKVPVKQKVVPLYKLFCLLCYSFFLWFNQSVTTWAIQWWKWNKIMDGLTHDWTMHKLHILLLYSVKVLTGIMKLSAHSFAFQPSTSTNQTDINISMYTFSSPTSGTTRLYDNAESTTFVDFGCY